MKFVTIWDSPCIALESQIFQAQFLGWAFFIQFRNILNLLIITIKLLLTNNNNLIVLRSYVTHKELSNKLIHVAANYNKLGLIKLPWQSMKIYVVFWAEFLHISLMSDITCPQRKTFWLKLHSGIFRFSEVIARIVIARVIARGCNVHLTFCMLVFVYICWMYRRCGGVRRQRVSCCQLFGQTCRISNRRTPDFSIQNSSQDEDGACNKSV